MVLGYCWLRLDPFQRSTYMIVEIRGVNFVNKGAELMLHAIVQQLYSWNQDNIAVSRPGIGSFRQRSQLGLYQLVGLDKKLPTVSPLLTAATNLASQKLHHQYGLITYSAVEAIFDASGFAYSDQWGPMKSEIMAKLSKRWKRQGKKIILLPQAFGPFETRSVKDAFLRVLDDVNLVFARDSISYDHLINLYGHSSHIQKAPDFTNLVKGQVPEYFNTTSKQPCIIPNQRMLDKTSGSVQSNYLSFLETCTECFIEMGMEPFILIHEKYDHELGLHIQDKFGQSVKVIVEPNPLYIKGILSSCYVVVSSRFHGLISALSQGVPCLATGWSHKYRMLFEDYGCPEYLVSSLDSKEEVLHKLKLLAEEPSRSAIISQINKLGLGQKKLASDMWTEVHQVLKA